MDLGKRNWLLAIIGLLGVGAISPAEAREECVPATQNGPVEPCVGQAPANAPSLVMFNNQTVRSTRSDAVDWGAGGLLLRGERDNRGRKPDNLVAGDRQWHRTVTAGASAWQDIAPGLTVFGGLRLSRVKSGSAGGPLLTRQTRTYSQEAFLGLKANDRIGFTLSAFDRGGWSPGDLTDVAIRMTNGEGRAGKGASVELALSGASSDGLGAAPLRLAFRLERSAMPSMGSDTSAKIAFHLSFR